MKQFIHFIVERLVDAPDKVEIVELEKGEGTFFEVRVAPNDRGKVIGKEGKTIRAIRAVLQVAAAKENKKVFIDIAQ